MFTTEELGKGGHFDFYENHLPLHENHPIPPALSQFKLPKTEPGWTKA